MNDINKRIAELSPAKRALLEQRLKQKAVNANTHQTISRRANQKEAPLSFAQTRMWLLDQLKPGNPAYNCPNNIRLIGQLDVAVLELCLNEIVRRHEVLRASFPAVDGQPVQVIAPSLTLTLPIVDISNLPSQDKQEKLQQLATAEAQRAFNLALGSLVRVTLVRLGESEHILLLTLHHIIFDGWSRGVFVKELGGLYEAFSAGKQSTLPVLPIQYADFAYWQRQHLQGEVLESQLAYWRGQLGSDLPVLELPTDQERSPQQTFLGARQSLLLPKSLTESLKVISQREGVTLFMTLLTAFKILLYRYTGQEDIVVGAPIAGRDRIETEKLIGIFINTLILRTYVDSKLTFLQLLATVRKVAIEAYEHQDIPFEKLVEELQPNRDTSHTPLFQVLFQLRNVPNETVEVQGLRFEDFQFDRGITAFDLTLDIVDTPEGLSCRFEYNTHLFDAATIVRMAGHFQTLLEGIVVNQEQLIGQLPLLTEAERHQLLVEWNNTQTDYPKDKCIHQLFEEQVERTPDAVAVVFEDEYLTYRELNCRANCLAHHLQALGVTHEVLVGICVERSLLMVVGVLGILKAGGAYVPLDPAYPPERLAFMLQDAQVSVLLTQQHLTLAQPSSTANVICLDTDWDAIHQQSQENPVSSTTANNQAYVMYTSGSTGRPKGVSIIHQGVVRLVKGTNYANFSSEEIFLQLAPFAFDVSTWEIWGSLLNGARLVLFPSRTPSLHELAQVIQQYQITTLLLTAGLFHLVVDEQLEALNPLRHLLTGGDVVSASHVQKFFQKLKNTKLTSCYGPTENTTFTTYFAMRAGCQIGNSVPIGRPIANTDVYILDRDLQPSPIGVSGEIYIGGAGLAREYFNRPELTAERFVSNPFSEGDRLYKTGDRARYLSDGNIEFLGRFGNQIKIRGNRIELGEVESALAQHPCVQQNVVTVREDIPGDKRLVAYVVPTPEGFTINELRRFLKQKLPDYMVPSAWVLLDQLPLTPNGKIDRRALPAPLPTRTTVETFVPPRTPVEEILANIWTKILQVQPIGIHDNFFELGGNSIKAMRLINELQAQSQISQILHATALFEAPTIAQLVAYLNEHYPEFAGKASSSKLSSTTWSNQKIEVAQIERMRHFLHGHLSGLSPNQEPQTKKNKRAIFILSPPRSGSTLLRVILGGHPQLFAPPELHLLSFNTLEERKATFFERIQFMREGLIRALMEIKSYSVQEAQSLMQELEDKKLTTKQFYDLMQQWLPGKTLVDKSPHYAFNPEVLKRAEIYFENPLYVHLLRHPYGTIRSMEEAKLDLLLSAQVKDEVSLSAKEKAELMWLISHQNIREFLEHIPAHRQYRLKFEDLVKQPDATVQGLCQFLGLSFAPEILQIYEDKKQRMTDGIHSVSRMLGDMKFHTHKEISAQAAELWKQDYQVDFLGEQTWQLAESFGYERITSFDEQEEGEI